MREVRLDRSEDGGNNWIPFAAIPGDGISVALPRTAGTHQFRLSGNDTLGRKAYSSAVGVTLLSGEDQLRIVTDLVVEAGDLAGVRIDPASSSLVAHWLIAPKPHTDAIRSRVQGSEALGTWNTWRIAHTPTWP